MAEHVPGSDWWAKVAAQREGAKVDERDVADMKEALLSVLNEGARAGGAAWMGESFQAFDVWDDGRWFIEGDIEPDAFARAVLANYEALKAKR